MVRHACQIVGQAALRPLAFHIVGPLVVGILLMLANHGRSGSALSPSQMMSSAAAGGAPKYR